MRGFRDDETDERPQRAGKEPVELKVRIAQDKPTASSLAVTDGTMETVATGPHKGQRRAKWFWLPRSQIANMGTPDRDGYVSLSIPAWLAQDRGLL